MDHIKIGNTDVILQEMGENKGKIIISHYDVYNFSFYWGAMGGTLKEFLLKINPDYFVTKLCPSGADETFSGKITARNVRKAIKEVMPWYNHTELQKEIREKIREEVENMDNERDFEHWADKLVDDLCIFCEIDDKYEARRVDEELRDIFREWWHLVGHENSRQAKFLYDIFPKIQKEVKAILKPELQTA